ncbi:hypothetical protein SAMN04488574_10723 [Bacillus sp. 71mf]|nr:hypothetical protein SAMN04488574_10723 [Bacillus sp. 71mf]SFT09658.1 hypothetical protein SAMN04488145_110123 [Bacillus sp. 103mf]
MCVFISFVLGNLCGFQVLLLVYVVWVFIVPSEKEV